MTHSHFSQINSVRQLGLALICAAVSLFAGMAQGQDVGFEQNEALQPERAALLAARPVPLMLLALPGRGTVMSAPGEVETIIIENASGTVCRAYLARTDKGGALEIPVARTAQCPSPRIVVHR